MCSVTTQMTVLFIATAARTSYKKQIRIDYNTKIKVL
jgi:hypothetical protein